MSPKDVHDPLTFARMPHALWFVVVLLRIDSWLPLVAIYLHTVVVATGHQMAAAPSTINIVVIDGNI